jgi:hypothetical protein
LKALSYKLLKHHSLDISHDIACVEHDKGVSHDSHSRFQRLQALSVPLPLFN